MNPRTKSKKQIIAEAKNLLTSLLEKQRKNNNQESLHENTSVWVKFCVIHKLKDSSYTRFIELCEANELIQKKSTVASKLKSLSNEWHKFIDFFKRKSHV